MIIPLNEGMNLCQRKQLLSNISVISLQLTVTASALDTSYYPVPIQNIDLQFVLKSSKLVFQPPPHPSPQNLEEEIVARQLSSYVTPKLCVAKPQ